ncbi:MAG: hypothetical protein OQK82_04230 [Candidatus Pacearchaeota archaeon]|nr:hypothetical protein [Candidatus Pacearchaeota archaeon]
MLEIKIRKYIFNIHNVYKISNLDYFMWRTLIQRFSEEDVTIDSSLGENIRDSVSPIKIGGEKHLILLEHQLKYCTCTDTNGEKQTYWTGDAWTECERPLKELEDERRPFSRTYFCPKSNYHVTAIKNSPTEREKHNNSDEYMGQLQDFD